MSSADKLYNLLPAVYRIRDSAQGEPLRALLSIMESELDAIDDDLTNLYENWFIETCQEWVAPYIGDLLGARGLKPISGGAFTARPYIAHTLKYRRSKGTAAMLEELAHDATNWPACVVEFFELLETTQNLNHLRLQNSTTLDFRDTNALELLDGAFDQASRTVEVRSAQCAQGRYNVPNVGIFLWRLESFRVVQAGARAVTDGKDGRFRFNPFGLDAPLFNQPQTLAEGERVSGEAQVPGALRRRALYDDLEAIRQAKVDNNNSVDSVYFGANPVIEVSVAGTPVPREQIIVCDLSDLPSPPGGWPEPPSSAQYTPSSGGAAVTLPITVSVDPVLGRLFFTASAIAADPSRVLVNYSYAFGGNLGGGPYERVSLPQPPPGTRSPVQVVVSKQLTADNKTVFATLTDAITAWNAQGAGARGIIAILDSEIYAESPSVTIPDDSYLLIAGLARNSNNQLEPSGVSPLIAGNIQVTGTAAANSQTPGGLILDGLLIDGSVTVEPGNLGSLQISDCTVRPITGSVRVAAQVLSAPPASPPSTVVPAVSSPALAPSPVLASSPVLTSLAPPVPKIGTTSPLPTATVGTPYSFTLGATGGSGFKWSASGLPPGLNLSTGGVLAGTPTAAGTFSVSVAAENSDSQFGRATLTLPVAAALAITTPAALPATTAGSAYSEALSATGGSGVYSWVAAGLPSWLTLSGAGVLTGVPPDIGSDSFSVTVSDSGGASKTETVTLAIAPPPLTINTTQLPGATTGAAYSQTLQGTGGKAPLTWSIIAGALPAGLTLATATGVISGTPTTAGTFTITAQLGDSAGTPPAKQPLTMVVTTGLAITTAATLPPVTINSAYSQTLAASGGTGALAWTISAGALPAGLALNPTTGAITGKPTAAGSFSFTAKVTQTLATATQAFTLTVAAAPAITTTSLPNATEGTAYSRALAATGGTAPLAWSVSAGALPAGLHLDAASGTISGNPTTSGSFPFTVALKDGSAATATQSLAIVVAPPLAIITAAKLPGGNAAVAYSQTLATTGGTAPLAWSVVSGSLPPGLTLSAAGVLSGTPTAGASSTFTAQVKDGAGASAAVTFSVEVAPPLTIATTALPEAEISVAYNAPLSVDGGTPPYSWALVTGAIPSGLELASSGSIQGTPTAVGSSSLTLKVTDSNSITASGVFPLTVVSAPTIATPATLPPGVAGSSYAVSLIVAGGLAPFNWAVTAGALPPGIKLDPRGTLDGVPGSTGTFTATVTVTDAAGFSSSRSLTVSIIDDNPLLTVSLSRSICGPLSLDAASQLSIVDCIVDAGSDGEGNPQVAIAAPFADASIQTSTILGTVGSSDTSGVRTLAAGNSIFSGAVFAERRQSGCVRFCYIPAAAAAGQPGPAAGVPASRTPRRYRSQPDLALKNGTDPLAQAEILTCLKPAFTSLTFGQPGYAQLSAACAVEIQTGAEDGAEMGVFNFLKQPQRQDNLQASLAEFLRFGLEAGIFFVT